MAWMNGLARSSSLVVPDRFGRRLHDFGMGPGKPLERLADRPESGTVDNRDAEGGCGRKVVRSGYPQALARTLVGRWSRGYRAASDP
jgi:hypothetical protein